MKLSKFKWNEIPERDSGHKKNKWGFQEKKSMSKTFVLFTVSWDD